MNIRNKTILKYLIEMLIVAFGVFLGMYVNEWRSNKKTLKNTEKTLNYIVNELETNAKNLMKSVSYHDTIRINLRALTKKLRDEDLEKPYFRNDAFRFIKIEKWTGIKLPKFETIAFDGAKINGFFQEVDIELVQLIASAYKQISFNQDFGKGVFDKMIQMDTSTKTGDAIGMVELLTSDVLNSEKLLNIKLENTISALNNSFTKSGRKKE